MHDGQTLGPPGVGRHHHNLVLFHCNCWHGQVKFLCSKPFFDLLLLIRAKAIDEDRGPNALIQCLQHIGNTDGASAWWFSMVSSPVQNTNVDTNTNTILGTINTILATRTGPPCGGFQWSVYSYKIQMQIQIQIQYWEQ